MSRPAGRAAAAIVVVIVAVVVGLAFFFPSSWARRLIVSRMESAMGRPVAVESARVRLFPQARIDVRGLAIGDSAAVGAPWITARGIAIGCRWGPLLHREVSITNLRVESPAVEFTMPPPGTASPPRGAGAPPASGAAFALRLEQVEIRDASVVVRGPDRAPFFEIDHASSRFSARVGAGADVDATIHAEAPEARLFLPGAVLGRDMPLTLDATLHYDASGDRLSLPSATLDVAGVPVEAEGTVSALRTQTPVADLAIHGGPADVTRLAGFVPAGMLAGAENVESRGTLEITGNVKGEIGKPGGPHYDVTLRLTGGDVRLPSRGREISDLTVLVRATPDTIDVKEFSARSGKSRLRLRGTFTGFPRTPRMRVAGDADVDLAELSALSPQADSLALRGRVQATFVAEGPPEPPEAIVASGEATLENVSVKLPDQPLPLHDVNGSIVMDRQTLYLHDVSLKLGSSDATLRGSVENPMALDMRAPTGARASADLRVKSTFLDADELMPPPAAGGAGGASRQSPAPLPPLDGSIAGDIATLRVRGITATHVHGTALLDRGVITLRGVGLDAFGGGVGLNGTVDLHDPSAATVALTADVSNVHASDLLAANPRLDRFGHLAGALTGNLSAHATLEGPLDSTLAIEPARLTSQGTLSVLDGKLAGLPAQTEIAQFLNLPQLSSVSISQWVQPFAIRDGRLTYDRLALKALNTDVVASGWQALDGSLESHLEIVLPPEAASALRQRLPAEAATVLLGEPGAKIVVPLVVSGTATKPSVSLDAARLTQEAQSRALARIEQEKNRLADEARRSAEEAARKAMGAAPDTTPLQESVKQKVKNEVQDRLKRLLGH